MRTPCAKCGTILHTGEGRITISFQPNELVSLIKDTTEGNLSARLMCALEIIDAETAQRLRSELSYIYNSQGSETE